jgi:hypothetical protein
VEELTAIEKLKSIVETFRRSFKADQLLATEEVRYSRYEICLACDLLLFDGKRPSCKKCGCGLTAKLAFSGSTCPLNKW